MSTRYKVILGVLIVGLVIVCVYLASRPTQASGPASQFTTTGTSNAAGAIAGVGNSLVGTAATIASAAGG